MIPELAATAHAYAVGDQFLAGLVGDFTEADWRVTDAAGHDPRWIAGHLAMCRLRVQAMLGLPEPEAPWAVWFGRGTRAADLPADLDPQVAVRAFHASQKVLAAHWERVTGDELAKPLGRTLPDGSDTFGGAIRFLAWHEAYHLGQLGLLRRLAGKPGRA
jgi:hypothetical protein